MHQLQCLTIFFVFNVCNIVISAEKAYIEKCCPYNYYVTTNNKCEKNATMQLGDITTLPVYNDALNNIGVLGKYLSVKISNTSDWIGQGDNTGYVNVKRFYVNWHLLENGTLLMKMNGAVIQRVTSSEYCMDYQIPIRETFPANISIWFKTTKDRQDSIMDKMKFFLPVSCVFLLLVLVVYCLLPELRTLGGLVLMAYVACLMFGYILLFSFYIRVKHFTGRTCIAMTLATYFFFLSSFCWLNVMAFDIWWTFRGYAKSCPIHRRGEHFKFKMYCLYAYGVPLAMTAATGLVTVYSHKLEGIVTPEIPKMGCFLQGYAKHYYLHVPLLILMICNWMFFIMTAFNIWRLSRGNKMLNSEDSAATGTNTSRNTHKQRFTMYLKLSILMGLHWILEVVSAQVPNLSIWYITDMYNILMGLVIFVIFVCKRKIFIMLKKRFKQQKLGPHQISTSFKSRSRSALDSCVSANTPLKPKQMQTFSIQP